MGFNSGFKGLRVVSNTLRRECAGTENRVYWSLFAAVEDISRKIPRVRETAVGEERVRAERRLARKGC